MERKLMEALLIKYAETKVFYAKEKVDEFYKGLELILGKGYLNRKYDVAYVLEDIKNREGVSAYVTYKLIFAKKSLAIIGEED